MLLHLTIGVFCLCVISAESNAANNTEEDDVYYPYYGDWSDSFDWKLLKAFSAQNYRNVIISPISLKLVLALLYEGSGGLTEKEFQNVLQFPVQKNLVRENFHQIIEALQPNVADKSVLNLGTRIFLDARITPNPQFATKALANYRTDFQAVNFSQPEAAGKTINSWIDKLTNGRVSQLVAPSDLDDAVMLIGNAIYFKGTWRRQFPRNRSAVGGFYISPTESVNVPYMKTTDRFFFIESHDLDAKILRLPYKGNRYALFIILPNSKGGLSGLINHINLDALKRQLYLMDKVDVDVCIPKFKFNFQTRLLQILKDFGLKSMFQNTASFPGIARGVPNLLRMLVVSDIVQKTGIEVDEEGSVVYSATQVQVGNKFGEADNVFNATHPFLFFVEEQTRGSILFVGKVENPLDGTVVDLPTRFGSDDAKPGVAPQPLESTPNLQPPSDYHGYREREAILRRFNYFDLELLTEFSETPGNVFISPASLKTTLALILDGAKGQGAQEIGNALRISNIDDKPIREILSRLLFDLNDRAANTVLEAANAVFVSNKLKIVPDYERKIIAYYKTVITPLDFGKSVKAAKDINTWASNATHGLINEIVSSQTLNGDTSLILANVLYFKGKWKTAFEEKNTKPKCFNSPTRGCVETPLMRVTDAFNYNFDIDLNAHVVELPYQDEKYAMLILLPSEGHNIKTLARDMLHSQLGNILNNLKPADLILELPRFEFEYSTDVVEFLRPLKIQEIFGGKANLSGIVAQNGIRISNIVHKTKVTVDEVGTRAAAATGAVVIPLMGSTPQKIVVDRPFIFFIYHKESMNIIFEGIFKEPTQGVQPATKSASRIASPLLFDQRYQRRF